MTCNVIYYWLSLKHDGTVISVGPYPSHDEHHTERYHNTIMCPSVLCVLSAFTTWDMLLACILWSAIRNGYPHFL